MIVHMIGNAHIDPVWLWDWSAGVDEALATVRSAADRCDEYPAFIFTRGEAWIYQQVERLDLDLFARVRRHIARGQWHVTGGQVVQPDGNIPTEAGWRRQILHGQRYMRERFGVRPTVGYNVDAFGHPATLPDLLAPLGYTGYVFGRPDARQLALPAQTFRWRGTGGAELLAFRITHSYNTRTDDIDGPVRQAIAGADPSLGHTMCFYGVGNHGGGPTKAAIEYIQTQARALPGVELRFSTPRAFFDAIALQRHRLPVVTEELQRCFPGCYSVMHDIKQGQRRGERLLTHAARTVDMLVDDADERRAAHARLDAAWDDLLFTQFHDILSGTSIPSAWPAVRDRQGRARLGGDEVVVDATRRWARQTLPPANVQRIVVVNPDADAFDGYVEAEPPLDFDLWRERWLSDVDGRPVPFQLVQAESPQMVHRVVFPLHLAGGGHAEVLVRDDAAPPPGVVETDLTETDLEATPYRLANRYLRLDLHEGGVRQLTVDGRAVLGAGGIGLHLRRDTTDTWTMDTDRFDEPVEEAFAADDWVVEEAGPLRARVRAEAWLGHSRVRWTLTLHRADPRLHLHLEVLFGERFRLLQLPIHLLEPPHSHTDGLPGGRVERAEGPTEWPVQGWSRVPTGAGYLALVTDDAYSLSLAEGRWQWTLLRGPKMAWMGDAWAGGGTSLYAGRDWHTDQGEHTFDIVLQWGSDLPDDVLHAAARQQGRGPIVFARYDGMDRPPWGNTPPAHLGGANLSAEGAG